MHSLGKRLPSCLGKPLPLKVLGYASAVVTGVIRPAVCRLRRRLYATSWRFASRAA